jgi:hypothetical protein
VTAGLPQSRIGIPFDRFVSAMYRAGARGSFQVLAIHPYARDDTAVVSAVADARRLMARFGDPSPIWVTELGWASGGPRSRFTTSGAGQAQLTVGALKRLRSQRAELGLRGVVLYNWRDAEPPAGERDWWGLHTGLVERDGRAKPVVRAVSRTIGLPAR